MGVEGILQTQVCGALDHPKHQGVLYLELPRDVAESASNNAILYFHAIRRTLNDCFEDNSED